MTLNINKIIGEIDVRSKTSVIDRFELQDSVMKAINKAIENSNLKENDTVNIDCLIDKITIIK